MNRHRKEAEPSAVHTGVRFAQCGSPEEKGIDR